MKRVQECTGAASDSDRGGGGSYCCNCAATKGVEEDTK